jgi:hypothetical protein
MIGAGRLMAAGSIGAAFSLFTSAKSSPPPCRDDRTAIFRSHR